MFESIVIRPNSSRNHPLNAGQVIESLFFYQKTVVHFGRNEIPTLYDLADPDVLENLFRLPYLSICFNNSHSAVVKTDGIRSVSFFGLANLDIEKELYEEAFRYKHDAYRSKKFARKVSRYVKVYELPHDFEETLQTEVKNQQFLKLIVKKIAAEKGIILLGKGDPKFELEFLDAQNFKVHTNIDISNPDVFNADSPLLLLVNAIEDMRVMADYSSEISLPEENASIVRLKANDLLRRTSKSQKEIGVFNHFAFDESWALSDAINSKQLHVKAILKVLEKAQPYKDWLNGLEEDSNLMYEYLAKVEEKSILERLPFKTLRFYLASGVGAILAAIKPEASIPVGVGISAMDAFLIDKLVKNWKPNQFIENELRPLVSKKRQ